MQHVTSRPVAHVLAAVVVALATGIGGAGCNNQENAGGKKKLDPAAMKRQRWDNARAGVKHSLARQQFEAGNFADARKSLDEALSLSPDHLPARILSARVHIETGKLDQAEKELSRAREIVKEAAATAAAAAAAQSGGRKGQNTGAAAAAAATATNAVEAEIDYYSGVIAQRWERPQQALDLYTSACEKAPDELPYLLARAEMLVTLDRRGEALEVLQGRLSYFENSAAIRDAVGQLLVQTGQYALAARVLRQAVVLAPEELGIREHLALAQFYAREYREAAANLERLLREERYRERVDLATALGECLMQMGRVREAREQFAMAAQLQPGVVAHWLNLGKAALELNDPGRAEMSLKKALAMAPESAEVHLMMGYLRLKQNRLPEALVSFRKSSELDPRDTTSLCMAGYVLEKQGRNAEAVKEYSRALRLKPNDELAAALLAQVQLGE